MLNTKRLLGLLGLSLVLCGGKTSAMDAMDDGTAVSSKPIVGAYYYPWYHKPWFFMKNKWHKQLLRQQLQKRQYPRAGLYDSRDEEVIGEHIEQSVRGGIDFWAVSWWGAGGEKDKVFKEHILTHPDAGKLKYAVLYESTGRFGKFANPSYDKWIGDLEYMKENYFSNPHYLKVDGRPVLFVYLSREYFRGRGGDALRAMRERFPEIYLVGDDVFFGVADDGVALEGYEAKWAANFDAVTSYDVYGQSVKPFGGTKKAIRFLSESYASAKVAANSVGTAFIPAIAPGYNDRATRDGHPGRARYFTDVEGSKEGDIFKAMIRDVALPNLDARCGNLMMVTSFNEWYEDSQIEATRGTAKPDTTDRSKSGTYYTGGQRYEDYGYLYLDILREETAGLSSELPTH